MRCVYRKLVQSNGPLFANGVHVRFARGALVIEAAIDLDIGVVEPVVARHVVGENFSAIQGVHHRISTNRDQAIPRLNFRIGHGDGLHILACHVGLVHFVRGLWAQEVQAVLVGMLREEIALVPIGQLLKRHGRGIDERVHEVEALLVHEPRKLVHQALVADGRQVDQGCTIPRLEVSATGVKIHMGRHVVCAKRHFIQIRARQFKRRHVGVDRAFLHQETLGPKFCPLKVERPASGHLGFGQLQLTFQVHLLSKELKGIQRGRAHKQSLAT